MRCPPESRNDLVRQLLAQSRMAQIQPPGWPMPLNSKRQSTMPLRRRGRAHKNPPAWCGRRHSYTTSRRRCRRARSLPRRRPAHGHGRARRPRSTGIGRRSRERQPAPRHHWASRSRALGQACSLRRPGVLPPGPRPASRPVYARLDVPFDMPRARARRGYNPYAPTSGSPDKSATHPCEHASSNRGRVYTSAHPHPTLRYHSRKPRYRLSRMRVGRFED